MVWRSRNLMWIVHVPGAAERGVARPQGDCPTVIGQLHPEVAEAGGGARRPDDYVPAFSRAAWKRRIAITRRILPDDL